jgi:hypothetical protein
MIKTVALPNPSPIEGEGLEAERVRLLWFSFAKQ